MKLDPVEDWRRVTEEIAATPGWFEQRLDEILSELPAHPAIATARGAYLDCVAAAKAPAAPSDMLGAEDERCHALFLRALAEAGVSAAGISQRLEALEAELSDAS